MTKIVFCLPGASFSREFVTNWTNAMVELSKSGFQVQAAFSYDANVFYVRNRILCGNAVRGVGQIPFDGQVDYDYLFWVDSDVLFSPDDVRRLLSHEKDIVSGCYIMSDNNHYPIVLDMDNEYFLKHGHYEFLDRSSLAALQGRLTPVAYVGFGFICIKKGVFEKLGYPFFRPNRLTFGTENRPEDEQIVEYASEDVSWCMNVRELGFDVWVDPTVLVGHQKLIPLK